MDHTRRTLRTTHNQGTVLSRDMLIIERTSSTLLIGVTQINICNAALFEIKSTIGSVASKFAGPLPMQADTDHTCLTASLPLSGVFPTTHGTDHSETSNPRNVP